MLSKNQEALLTQAVEDLAMQMEDPENSALYHVRQNAFDWILPGTGESVQVHITITRDENDFLGFLETECMS